jgi:hypothetical protein
MILVNWQRLNLADQLSAVIGYLLDWNGLGLAGSETVWERNSCCGKKLFPHSGYFSV